MSVLMGRVALITGAESGIGRACVVRLARAGAHVMAVGLREVEGAALEREMADAGLSVQFAVCDVSRAETAASAVERAVEVYGRLDILVNCAGTISFGSVEECSEEEWDRVLRVNVKAIFLMSRLAMPHLRVSGTASIVNIASTHAVATMERVAAYAASKAAVVGLTRQMAIDYAAEGIRVNSLVVGGVDTDMSRAHMTYLGFGADVGGFVPGERRLGRVGAPDEIARAVLFLASDDSSFVTGSAMVVDGGALARSGG